MHQNEIKISVYIQWVFRAGLLVSMILLFCKPLNAQVHKIDEQFPVQAEIFVDEPFAACEGIAFNSEGDLFVTANRALWKVVQTLYQPNLLFPE